MAMFSYQEAKDIISEIILSNESGKFETREHFMERMEQAPYIAVQGYNGFGKIFYWNMASSNLYGHTESEAINQDLVELLLPDTMRQLARTMIAAGAKTGHMPDAASCDLLKSDGEYITVYSGHLVFHFEDATVPEFYCIDVAIDPDPDAST